MDSAGFDFISDLFFIFKISISNLVMRHIKQKAQEYEEGLIKRGYYSRPSTLKN